MTGVHDEKNKICPICGGLLEGGYATIPFIVNNDTIIVVKNVPAEICSDCHEPFTNGVVTDRILELLKRLKLLKSEVSVVSFTPEQYALP